MEDFRGHADLFDSFTRVDKDFRSDVDADYPASVRPQHGGKPAGAAGHIQHHLHVRHAFENPRHRGLLTSVYAPS